MPRTGFTLLSIALLLGASACGGQGDYSAAATRACLEEERRARVTDEVDFVASTASGGSFHVRLPKNRVTITFSASRDEAGRIVRGYERFKGETIGLEDVLRVERNVVMLWAAHPEDRDLATIHDCLE